MIYAYADSSPFPIFAAPVYLHRGRSISLAQDTHPCRRKYPLGEEELNSPRSFDVSMAVLHVVGSHGALYCTAYSREKTLRCRFFLGRSSFRRGFLINLARVDRYDVLSLAGIFISKTAKRSASTNRTRVYTRPSRA